MSAETMTKEMERIGDPPGPQPEDRLAHVLSVFAYEDDGRNMVTATTNCYPPPNKWTGLTMGDLRRLDSRMKPVNAPDLARHVMDALELPADTSETAMQQAAITAAIAGWFAPEQGDDEHGGD
jgi:hypothetical protein